MLSYFLCQKKIGIIGGVLGIILLIVLASNEANQDNPTDQKENQENQTSLNQDFQNKLDKNKKDNLELEQINQPAGDIEKRELFFKVVKVVDGDTITLENGEVVRYVGIDTPETVHPSKPVQCFGKEASDKNKELVEGKIVKVEKDISNRDKYNRLLYYVWVGDLFVNDYLVRQGYAYAYTYPPDVKYAEQFAQAQKEARENNRGLWAGCSEKMEVMPLPIIPPIESTNKLTQEIICSSNTYNCSDFSTQAEAQNVFEYCGGTNNDIHRLDADKDNSACESLP